MNITMIGTGYVGLVTGTCFAEMGVNVFCVDADQQKISDLREGILSIYEPTLASLVANNHSEGRLKFTTSITEGMKNSNVFFIAVGTPSGENGSADLSHVLTVAKEIGQNLSEYAVIVNKSTVPVGTAEMVRKTISKELAKRNVDIPFDVVSNPEFLKEGAAVEDFMRPDRIIIGAESEQAFSVLHRLYSSFSRNHDRILNMGTREAEMTKYAANAMLATKISFMNEIAGLCDNLSVDVEKVRMGIGADSRIGYSFIYPGCGYGGSCFPKDIKALIHLAENNDCSPILLQAVHNRNEQQKQILFAKITAHFGNDLSGLTFGIWGLAFKPETDDIREATALILIHALIKAGAKVRAYDPEAMINAREEFPQKWIESETILFADHQYDALDKVDAMILVTEWKPFRHPDFAVMRKRMKQRHIFDGRNLYDISQVKKAGFKYNGIGRSCLKNGHSRGNL
jgi:UDPglucose 6-dehydrogenase